MFEYITKEGMQRLHQKMKQLIDERAGVIKQVVEAREMGDLSENAEYHAAREKQRAIENEYNRLKTRISQLQVLDPAKLSKDAARFGARVHIKCLDTGEEIYLQLVGVDEIFKSEDKYERTSILSPRGKAIIGKKIGDLVTVIAPIGEFRYEILSIE